MKVPKDASHRDIPDARLRSDLAPRRSPSACAEKVLKIDPHSAQVLVGLPLAVLLGWVLYSYASSGCWPLGDMLASRHSSVQADSEAVDHSLGAASNATDDIARARADRSTVYRTFKHNPQAGDVGGGQRAQAPELV